MMNPTLKPVLPASSQNANSATPNKSMHPQGAPMSYGQPSGPISQNPFPNPNMAHNHPTTQQNHYSLNVPGGGSHFNMGTIPASNHPVAISQPKNASYSSGFQHGVGLTTQNQNTLPPVSQTLPATTTSSTTVSQSSSATQNLSNSNSNSTSNSSPIKEVTVEKEKSQPNGTSEVESPVPAKTEKPEVQDNHVTTEPTNSAPQPQENKLAPHAQTPQQISSEKPKPVTPPQEKKPIQEPKHVPEPKPVQEPSKVTEELTPTPQIPKPLTVPTPQAVPATPVPVPEPTTAPVPSSEPAEPEPVQNDAESPKDAPETDPLAFDGSPIVSDEKPIQGQEKVVPIIQTEDSKDESEIDEKSSDDQSSDECESEKGQKDEDLEIKTPVRKTKATKAEPKTTQKSPSSGKTKRQRIRTQHYQSPLPEIEIITKITSVPRRNRNTDDKLIYFYKNEFLAVRNAEGGFYLCQAVQNIYKSSSKIKIRWLNQDKSDKSGEIYTPDFYDLTDFDCILTSLDLTRVGKGRYKLKPAEKLRTDSILKRCLAVEKGEISQPSVSAEHPDGLDLSLYKDEEQLKKKTKQGTKRKGRPRSASPKKASPIKKSPEAPKVRKVESKPPSRTSAPAKKAAVTKKAPTPEPKKATPTTSRAARGKRKASPKTSPVVDQKKAKVLAKIGRKNVILAPSTKPQTSRSARVSKPTPSTSKVTKTAPASKPPPRKAKRSGRK